MIDLLRAERGDACADHCATIKKKADLAVNVSGWLAAGWLPGPCKMEPDQAERDDFDADAFDGSLEGDDIAGVNADGMA